MTDLPQAAVEALDAFTQASGWEQRARLLMQWGERLEPLSESERSDANLVSGCESHVWLVGVPHAGRWHFRATSDARLIRGLLAVLLARVNGLDAGELAAVDMADWFSRLGLSRQLSPSRSNGMTAVLRRMRELTG
ncbi:Fe-S metabolism protein SufE [Stutzerimonas decontaminans]|uniref:Fe-S metabolism protein SufE n=2 Tax=Stutzerimonas TaxID=2901164 RepID=A0ABX4W1Y3_9GAMM|nr:SufE family protein [Stutzerimonas decontaminans]AHY42202.1 Fe-S metabolism protein SufE [Stutzerimonas decontaminans]MCQ4245994.1 SufE family protein [Stutzerimonas decontaminans]MCW8157073.1 SufE family protein [Stutzerimonas stutzeri]PNF86469.1 Fe-S metabolism protein SufE [Stutzerimonas decontaminans]